ncbi:hypothetical protein ACLKA6_002111 [Drosophila palustris]
MKSESARNTCQDNLPLNPSRLPTSTACGSRVSHRQLQQQPHSHLAVTKPIYVTRQPAMLSPSPSPSPLHSCARIRTSIDVQLMRPQRMTRQQELEMAMEQKQEQDLEASGANEQCLGEDAA